MSGAQLATLAFTFVAVVGLVGGSAYYLNRSSYRVLYSDMEPEAASELVAQLRSRDVPFRLDEGGRTVRVPAERLDELRLDLAGQGGLPASGRIGFEIFDRTAFGATEFLEHVNYRRALEGEIARTIATLSEVSSARVHIAMAKPSLFATRSEPAKASVVLKLRGRQPLSKPAIDGVRNLVAASVEGLKPDAIVLLDSFGNPLARPTDDDEPLGYAQMERQRRLESDLTKRVVMLLEPVVGIDRVRVDISVRLDPESQEETEERWDPDTVIRSRQVTTEVGTPTLPTTGVAGARANSPVAGDDAAGVAVQAVEAAARSLDPPSRGTETTNYEVSKVVRHTLRPRGEISRLSVAVIVDDAHLTERGDNGTVTRSTQPRDPDELKKLEGLVAAAVGLDTSRGDHLTVENIAFDEPQFEEPEPPSTWQTYRPQITDGARILAVVLLGLLAFFVVLRPLMKRLVLALPTAGAVQVLSEHQLPRTVEDLEGDLEAELDAASGTQRKMPILQKRLTEMTSKSPESAARLLRTWLAEEEG